MPVFSRIIQAFSINKILEKHQKRRQARSDARAAKASAGTVSEKLLPEEHVRASVYKEPLIEKSVQPLLLDKQLPGLPFSKPLHRRHASEPVVPNHFRGNVRMTTTCKEVQLKAAIESPDLKESPLEVSTGRLMQQESILVAPDQASTPRKGLTGTYIEKPIKAAQLARRKRPKATAQNNRLLALPREIRMMIYDELLAIPRTIYMLEAEDSVKSHLHKIRKFDKELFCRRGRLRYKFSHCRIGYYDPRTTTFAARFVDDNNCTYRIWRSDPNATTGFPNTAMQVSAPVNPIHQPMPGVHLIFPLCSVAMQRQNKEIWLQILVQLRYGPAIYILELEFSKICSLITMLKFLLLQRLPGWRDLRKLSVIRFRLRAGDGGPLNVWEMLILCSLSAQWTKEMTRQVALKTGPKIEIAW